VKDLKMRDGSRAPGPSRILRHFGRKLGAVETMTVDGGSFASDAGTLLPYFEVGTTRAPTIVSGVVEVTATVSVTFTLE
jgi:hypothetical protein